MRFILLFFGALLLMGIAFSYWLAGELILGVIANAIIGATVAILALYIVGAFLLLPILIASELKKPRQGLRRLLFATSFGKKHVRNSMVVLVGAIAGLLYVQFSSCPEYVLANTKDRFSTGSVAVKKFRSECNFGDRLKFRFFEIVSVKL